MAKITKPHAVQGIAATPAAAIAVHCRSNPSSPAAMLASRKRELSVLNISALDLFASALGVFILMTLILFPYYLKKPALDDELEGAKARGLLASEQLALAEFDAADATEELLQEQQARGDREAELESARKTLKALQKSLADAKKKAGKQTKPVPGPKPHGGSARIPDLDLVLVMDTTGSMHREIAAVQRSLLGMVKVLKRLAPSLRVGFVAFKDSGEVYVTRSFPLRNMDRRGIGLLRNFVGGLEASGGGDYAEPVGRALREATRMSWRDNAQGRIVLVGDAPDNRANRNIVYAIADDFNRSSRNPALPRRISTVFTGQRSSGRTFYQQVAMAGQGDAIQHQGAMLSSVLLSILDGPR